MHKQGKKISCRRAGTRHLKAHEGLWWRASVWDCAIDLVNVPFGKVCSYAPVVHKRPGRRKESEVVLAPLRQSLVWIRQ